MTLDDALDYDPLTGILVWKTGTRNADKVAGSFNKSTGYIHVRFEGRAYYAHRVAWYLHTGLWPRFVDHENGVTTDNWFKNLRDVPKRINHLNMRRFSNNRSSVTGVHWRPDFRKWVAIITVNRRDIHLGSFSEFTKAVAARKHAEQLHGFHPNHGRC